MGSRMTAWRPALRIARRDMVRAKGRSALVAAMVGLPVALVTCFASVYATNNVSDVESIPSRIGATAAELQVLADGPVWQDPQMMQSEPVARDPDGNPVDLGPSDANSSETVQRLQQLTGGRIIDVPSAPTLIRTDRGRLQATVVTADVTSPQLRGLVRLQQGRLPGADDEVLVSHTLAERGFTVGSTIALADGARSATVVGIGEVPYLGARQTVVARAALRRATESDVSHRYLLERATPVTWAEVKRLNQSGVIAFSRAVVEHPPTDWRASLPQGAQPWNTSTNAAEKAVLVLVIFSIVLEVVLLAGPAFAVGVRRQSRQLALVAATGGSARDIRRIVLAQGIALGAGASLLGAGVGVGVARLLVWALPRFRGTPLGPWDVDWLSSGLAVLLGAVAAVVAAWAPARAASRTDVVAVLAGRRGQARTPRGWPVVGAILVGAGATVAFTVGTRPGGEFGVAGGTLLMVLGAIALMPALIGLVGRLGAHLPLPLRLAARDSARQRGRTAPAVAAVMAAVAGVTALAIGGSSDAAQARLEYEPRQPAGVTTIQTGGLDAQGWAAVDRAVREQTGRVVQPVGSLAVPMAHEAGSEPPGIYVPGPGCPAMPPVSDSASDVRCALWQTGGVQDGWTARGAIVAEPDALEQLGYRLTTAQRTILAKGGVLLPNADLVHDGKATVVLYRAADDGPTGVDTVTVPAGYLAPRRSGGMPEYVALVLTPASAEAHHLTWVRDSGVLVPGEGAGPLTKEAQDQLSETLAGMTPYVDVYTERGYVNDLSLPLLGLTIIGGLAVLIGTLTATGLALADSRPDLATLAAVGARSRTRRVMAASQALVIGLLGAVTGVLVGLVPGIAVTWPLTSNQHGSSGSALAHGPIIAIPWLLLAAVGVAVPVIASLFAGTAVRSRLPLTRRLGQ